MGLKLDSVNGVVMLFGFFFFFNDTATTEIYTLSLHDALPILHVRFWVYLSDRVGGGLVGLGAALVAAAVDIGIIRSEEHTSELQSLTNLVCRLLLEKKKK